MHTMVTCKHCGKHLGATDLVRHEEDGLVMVHCPDCRCVLGIYKQHGQRPQTDTLRG